MKKRDKQLVIIVTLTVLSMVSLLIYGMWTKHNQVNLIQSYQQTVETNMSNVDVEIEKAQNYNKVIQDFVTNGGTSSTVNSLDTYDSIFSENDGMIGILTVPKIDLRLPIYHGTDDATLDKGVGHVSDTAFPMDTVGTKSVLTGHNGMPGADMLFTRLDETDIGDKFVVQIGDIGFHYKVKQMTVVTPEEAEVYAQEPINVSDPANVTLITCTPYGINSHRLLVIGEFVKKAKVSENANIIPKTGYSMGKETIVIVIIIIIGLGVIGWVFYKAKKNTVSVYSGYEVDDQYWCVD